jgi:hypothetical protein
MKSLACVLVLIAFGNSAHAGSTEALMKRWYTLEDKCRGNPLAQENKACRERDSVVSPKLEALGYCYTGTAGADMHWEFTGSRAWCRRRQELSGMVPLAKDPDQ